MPRSSDPQPWDPGLQPERTTLAWVRTGLALAVVSLLLTRLTGVGSAALAIGLGGMVVGAALVVGQSGRHRRNDVSLRSAHLRPAAGASAGLMVAIVVLAAVAAVLVLSSPSK